MNLSRLGGNNSKPRGNFEITALAAALNGDSTQEADGNTLRTVVPLANLEGCGTCHANYGPPDGNDYVGAASFEVHIGN